MRLTIFWVFSLLMMSSCTDVTPLQSVEGSAQGTTYQIRYWSAHQVDKTQLAQAVTDEFLRIDLDMSGYRTDSIIEQFNSRPTVDAQIVSTEIVQLVERARSVNKASGGCYDLTIKPLFDLWGFTEDRFVVPETQKVQEVLGLIGMDKVTTVDHTQLRKQNPAVKLDLSSIGQGYSAGRLAAILEHHDIQNYLVEIGGELQVRGNKPGGQPWRVAIERPLPGERSIQKVITIADGASPLAVMTSGTYRHFYDSQGVRYSHILDARNGFPITHSTVSVTVLYPDATMADAWSTALLCLGADAGVKIANEQGIPALFIEQQDNAFKETFSEPLRQLRTVNIE